MLVCEDMFRSVAFARDRWLAEGSKWVIQAGSPACPLGRNMDVKAETEQLFEHVRDVEAKLI